MSRQIRPLTANCGTRIDESTTSVLRLNESSRRPLYYDPSDNKPKQTDESWNNPPASNVLMEVPELRSLNWNSQSSRSINVVPPYFAYLFMQSGTGETDHRNLLQSENKTVDSQQQTENTQ